MHRRSSQLAITAVTVVLGLLVAVQLRSQTAGSGLEGLSSQDLTVLVANLSARNDQLRTEIASTERQLRDLAAGRARGETSLSQIQGDLARIRSWSGLVAVAGPGVRVAVAGPVPGPAVEDLLNELRNAGAEAIAVGGVRIVPGSVVVGVPGELTVEGRPLADPVEVVAIGNAQTLVGSLTRVGGIVAQLGATYPDARIDVLPVDRLELPATERSLAPGHGKPRL